MIEVRPYVGVGAVTFGMSQAQVEVALGLPDNVRESYLGETQATYETALLTFDKDGLAEVGLFPEAEPHLGSVKVLTESGFAELLRLDGEAFEHLGFIVLLNLGLTVTGVHDGDRSQLAATAFRKGRWDGFRPLLKPYRG